MNRPKSFGPAGLSAFALLLCSAAALSRPTLEDYAAPPTVHMMSVSPDGKLVAFRRHKYDQEDDQDIVVVFSLDHKKILTGLDVSQIRPTELYFLDQAHVILAATSDDFVRGYRGHHRMSSAFSLSVASGKVEQLLRPGDRIITGQVGLGRIVGASADGRRVYMPAFTTRRVGQEPDYSLMEVDLGSVRNPRMHKRGSRTTIDYFVDENGELLVEERFDNGANQHRIISYTGGEARDIYVAETEVPRIAVVALTADRKSLIFSADSESSDRLGYYSMSLADGAVSAPVFLRPDADVESILTDVNRIAFGVVYSGLRPTYEFFAGHVTRSMQDIQAKFPGDSVWLADASADLRHLVVRVEGATSSGDYYLFSDDGAATFLSSSRPEIPAALVNPVIAYEFEARDGAMIPSLLTVPADRAEDPQDLPAVMLPHGGPEAHDWLGFDWFAQALASRGYAVIQPQFRGSSGFGVQHLLAGRGEWGRKSQDDITDALKHMVADGVVDAERVCIAGMSYGGFAALAGGAFTPELYRCVVSVNGVSDVRKMLKQERREHGASHSALAYWGEIIARGDTSKETLDTISPGNAAASFRAPVLLVHGEKDNVVDYDQSRHMEKQLQRADRPVTLVKLRNEDHFLSSPGTRIEALRAVVEFIDTHIGGKT